MKAADFDKNFDEGNSIVDALDLEKRERPLLEQKRINVDIPIWMIELLDKEAKRLGVTRQSVIKFWLAERLEGSSGIKSA